MAFSLKSPMDIPNGDVEKRYVQHGGVSYDYGKGEVPSQPMGAKFIPGERAVPTGPRLPPCPEVILTLFISLMSSLALFGNSKSRKVNWSEAGVSNHWHHPHYGNSLLGRPSSNEKQEFGTTSIFGNVPAVPFICRLSTPSLLGKSYRTCLVSRS
jgi:hypothetical protein